MKLRDNAHLKPKAVECGSLLPHSKGASRSIAGRPRRLRAGREAIAAVAQASEGDAERGREVSYSVYPECEESGVAWIGRKPKHWQVMKLHHVVRMRSGSSITSLEMEDDGEYSVFGGNGIRGKFPQYTHEGSYVLIGRQGAECGNINYAHGKFWASEHAVVATPDRELNYRWLGETLRAMNLNQYSQSAAQPGLSVEVIGRLKMPFPPVDEQQQIAAFLDWKTGQIDGLLGKKKELLEKRKEKRIAVITQAVTQGLNPAAPKCRSIGR